MPRAIFISPDSEVSDSLFPVVEQAACFEVRRVLTHYPQRPDLVRILRAHSPQVAFVGVQNLASAREIFNILESEAPGLQVVALDRACDQQRLLETMRAGVREFMAPPFTAQALAELAARLDALLEKQPATTKGTEHIYAFVPAKAGSGTSTVAMNVAQALSRLPGSRVLLADFDLSSGMQRFLLNVENEYSVCDALEHAAHMDEQLWPQLVATLEQLDILHAGRLNPNQRIEPEPVHQLIDYLSRQYTALCFDLSGNMERYSLEVMQQARRVFLVSTPEVPSLHLAREKVSFLKRLELEREVALIINRYPKRGALAPKDIEDLVGAPVFRTIPNDYAAVVRAMNAASYVDPATELGRSYVEFAGCLADRHSGPAERKKKRFIEYFALTPRHGNDRGFEPSVPRRLMS